MIFNNAFTPLLILAHKIEEEAPKRHFSSEVEEAVEAIVGSCRLFADILELTENLFDKNITEEQFGEKLSDIHVQGLKNVE